MTIGSVGGGIAAYAQQHASMTPSVSTAKSVSQVVREDNAQAAQALQNGAGLLGDNNPKPGARVGSNIDISVWIAPISIISPPRF